MSEMLSGSPKDGEPEHHTDPNQEARVAQVDASTSEPVPERQKPGLSWKEAVAPYLTAFLASINGLLKVSWRKLASTCPASRHLVI